MGKVVLRERLNIHNILKIRQMYTEFNKNNIGL